MTETELLGFVTAMCDDRAILWTHVPDSRLVQGDRGVPDIIAAGSYGVVFAELKDDQAALTANQTAWRYTLTAGGAQWRLWRPADLRSGLIGRELDAIAYPAAQTA